MKLSKPLILTLGTTCILFPLCLIVICISVFGFWYWDKSRNYTEVLSDDEKAEVLANALRRNPTSIISPQPGIGEDSTTYDNDLSDEEAKMIAGINDPSYKNYNYSYFKMSFEYGEAVSKCSFFEMFSSFDSVETYEFIEDGNSYFNNYLNMAAYDDEGNVIMINIDTPSEGYMYMGGKYAVKTVHDYSGLDETLDETLETIETEDNEDGANDEIDENKLADTYFGEDAEVEKVVENGKVKYYIVTWNDEYPCDIDDDLFSTQTSTSEPELDKIVNRTWIDGNTQEIVKAEVYLKELNEDNLLLRATAEIDYKDTNFNDVKDKFTFDYDVEVKEISYDYDSDDLSETERIENYLKNNPTYVLMPTSPDYEFSYGFAYTQFNSLDSFEYLSDRNFYAEGEMGDKMYDLFGNSLDLDFDFAYPSMIFSYNTIVDYYYFDISIYDKETSNDSILTWTIYTESDISEPSSIQVKIDDLLISGQKYDISEEDYDNNLSTTILIVFEYGNHKYVLDLYDEELFDDLSNILNFKSYNSADANQFEAVMKIIEVAMDYSWENYDESDNISDLGY